MATGDPTREAVKRRRDTLQAGLVARIVRDYMPALEFSPEPWKCFPSDVVKQASAVLDPFFG